MEIQSKILKQELVNWRDLEWLQTKLKDIPEIAFSKLKESIKNNNFVAPFNVWENGKIWILDGHHRKKALEELEKEGYKIPSLLPANFIECKNKKEASKLVLVYSSMYANVTEKGLTDFLFESGLTIDDIKFDIDLPGVDLEQFSIISQTEEKLNEVPETPRKAISKLGDLFELTTDGIRKHKVLCGDATNISDVKNLTNEKNIRLSISGNNLLL